jgi:hypothetical protein
MQDPASIAASQLQQLIAQLQRQQALIPTEDHKIARHKFAPEEDELLRNLVTQLGSSDWTAIAAHFHNRTARQCRERWRHYVSPEVVVGSWSESDDQMLMRKVAEFGPRWSAIAQLFPGRTDIGVKNRYISLVGKKTRELGQPVLCGADTLLSLPPAYSCDGSGSSLSQPKFGDTAHQIGK